MRKVLYELGNLTWASRLVSAGGILLATTLMVAAIFFAGSEELLSRFLSLSLADVSSSIFAISVIGALTGEYIIRKKGNVK